MSEAALYPSLNLGGTVTSSDGTSWSFGPTLSLPVVLQGTLSASRDQAIARADQARLTWRATVLAAVEDVQAAQTDFIRNRRAVEAYRQSVASYQRVTDLSRQTYDAGTTTLLDLLDAASSWATLQVAGGLGWTLSRPAETD